MFWWQFQRDINQRKWLCFQIHKALFIIRTQYTSLLYLKCNRYNQKTGSRFVHMQSAAFERQIWKIFEEYLKPRSMVELTAGFSKFCYLRKIFRKKDVEMVRQPE